MSFVNTTFVNTTCDCDAWRTSEITFKIIVPIANVFLALVGLLTTLLGNYIWAKYGKKNENHDAENNDLIRHQADLIKHLHEQLKGKQQRKKEEAPKNLATGPNAEPPNINGTPMPSASTGFDLIVLLFIVIFFLFSHYA
uniref:Uncharacterized protein n=1 Tax=Acrobeloides nanus TaxID=290746 RepID=A0A914E550_9BILA